MDNNLEANWPGPEGMIPSLPKNAANAAWHTRRYFDEILIEMRVIGAEVADLTYELWGEKFSSPIMMPAFSHLNKVGMDIKPMQEYAKAAKAMNLVNWVGMESDEEYAEIAALGAKTIRIIKPFRDTDIIKSQIQFAAEHDALAVGVDIDHSIGTDGELDVVDGYTMGTLNVETLAELVKVAHDNNLPFIAKGVLSVADAKSVRDAGVDAIVVSHHHGRMAFAIPPVMVLPEIKQVSGNMKVFVDCGIDDGRDAYKAMALGADAVSVGRGILPGLLKEGQRGVEDKVTKMNQQLQELMGYTSVRNVNEFDSSVLWYQGKQM